MTAAVGMEQGEAGADLGGGGKFEANFEAQIFAIAATPLRYVGKLWRGPPLHKSWIRTWEEGEGREGRDSETSERKGQET